MRGLRFIEVSLSGGDNYPFGLTFNPYQRQNSVDQKYLDNGKELQDELQLDWLDYGARMYMALDGALIGGTFWATEKSYDGIVWYGNELSRGMVQTENAFKNGWYPGR